MKSVKPGRGPSMMGGVVSVALAVFGLLWTMGASSVTSSYSGIGSFSDPSFVGGGIDVIFPLFGLVFVFVAIASAVYNFKNATGEQRFSEYDIVDSKEEADPLNEYFGGERPSVESGDCVSEDRAFCPYCGKKVESDYRFCAGCGRKLPHND